MITVDVNLQNCLARVHCVHRAKFRMVLMLFQATMSDANVQGTTTPLSTKHCLHIADAAVASHVAPHITDSSITSHAVRSTSERSLMLRVNRVTWPIQSSAVWNLKVVTFVLDKTDLQIVCSVMVTLSGANMMVQEREILRLAKLMYLFQPSCKNKPS